MAGVVGEGIAFVEAISKITSCAIKLRGMWKDFKEIPDSIITLVGEIEMLSLVLQPMEADWASQTPDGGLWGCSVGNLIVMKCREAVDVFSSQIDQLSQDLISAKRVKRAMIKGKLVMNKDFWAKTEQGLQRVFRMLVVALQLWTHSSTTQRLDSATQRLDMVISLSQNSDQHEQANDSSRTLKKTHDMLGHRPLVRKSMDAIDTKQSGLVQKHLGKSIIGSVGLDWTRSNQGSRRVGTPYLGDNDGCDKYYAQFKPPNWLTTKAWSIATSIGTSGFQINLRVYSVVPETSLVFDYARRGNIEGLLDLFDSKLASPFDINERGERLIDVAAKKFSQNKQVVAAMIDWGLDMTKWFEPGEDMTLALIFSRTTEDLSAAQAFHEIALANNVYDDYANVWLLPHSSAPNHGFERYFLVYDSNALKLFLPHLRPGHYGLSAPDRLFFLISNPSSHADSLRYLLWSDGKVQKDDIQALDAIGIPLLKYIVANISPWEDTAADWWQLVREILPLTTLLHSYTQPEYSMRYYPAVPPSRGTPLHAVANIYCGTEGRPMTFSEWRRNAKRALQRWLEEVQASDIDLNEYGRMEAKIFRENDRIRTLRYIIAMSQWDEDGEFDGTCSLATFSYGPEPKDWKFTWVLECDGMVGQFWELIDRMALNATAQAALKMPGAWVDD